MRFACKCGQSHNFRLPSERLGQHMPVRVNGIRYDGVAKRVHPAGGWLVYVEAIHQVVWERA